MKRTISLMALVMTGAIAASSALAAERGYVPNSFLRASLNEPLLALDPTDHQRDVIQPPSTIDPGMAIDPPNTGARMPIIHPPGG